MFQVLHTSALFSGFRFGRGNLVQRLRSRAHRLIVRRQLKTPHVETYQDKGNENRKKKPLEKMFTLLISSHPETYEHASTSCARPCFTRGQT